MRPCPFHIATSVLITSLLLFQGCYSFTTVSLPPELNTIRIETFQNTAPLVVPNYAQEFTYALQDRFINQSRLTLVNRGGDVILTGVVTDYRVEAVNVQQNDQAAQNRLTITVEVAYENTINPTENWVKTFSQRSEFSQTQTLNEVQATLHEEINDILTREIFNKAFGNW